MVWSHLKRYFARLDALRSDGISDEWKEVVDRINIQPGFHPTRAELMPHWIEDMVGQDDKYTTLAWDVFGFDSILRVHDPVNIHLLPMDRLTMPPDLVISTGKTSAGSPPPPGSGDINSNSSPHRSPSRERVLEVPMSIDKVVEDPQLQDAEMLDVVTSPLPDSDENQSLPIRPDQIPPQQDVTRAVATDVETGSGDGVQHNAPSNSELISKLEL